MHGVQGKKKTAYVVFRRLWENEMEWAHRFTHGAMPNHSRRHRKTEHANVGSLFLFQPFKMNTKLKHLGTVLNVLHSDLQWQLELVTYSFLLLEEWSQLSFSRLFFFFLITFILFLPFCNVIFKSILCISNVVFKPRKFDFNNGLHNGLICLMKYNLSSII